MRTPVRGGVLGACILAVAAGLPGCGNEERSLAPRPEFPPLYVLQWGSTGADAGEFTQPGDMEVGPDGSVYVIDHQNHRVQKFTSDGTFLGAWGNGPPTGNIFSPLLTGVAVGMGRAYVSDHLARTWVLTENGDPLESWDYYSLYGGITIETFGKVVISGFKILARYPVLIVEGPAVWVLSRDGREIDKLDLQVYCIAAGPRGTLYGVQIKHIDKDPYSRIVHFTPGGEILRRWPWTTESTSYDNIAVDAKGFIYVVERPSYRVTKFAPDGERAVCWTETGGTRSNFSWPVALAVDEGLSVYVSDFWNDRVVKFSPPLAP